MEIVFLIEIIMKMKWVWIYEDGTETTRIITTVTTFLCWAISPINQHNFIIISPNYNLENGYSNKFKYLL